MKGKTALGLWNRIAGEPGGFDPNGDGVFRLENGVDSRLSRRLATRQLGDFDSVTLKVVFPIDDQFVMEIHVSH